ncbi:MAG: DUF4416 family protein [Planctomycetes bacterium]|nr:DUF4416 family protein [Planctomycetota bacterium]
MQPEPVQYFVAILWADASALPLAYARLRDRWGAIDFEGPDHPFDRTTYYEPEMGPNLVRRLIAFATLRCPGELARAKNACIEIEKELPGPTGRRVNLDIGYLDHNKIVLASVKAPGQKIYLSDGIFADLVARYSQGRYQPFEWTFPDFKDGRYDTELAEMRSQYIRQRKGLSEPEA